MYGASVVGPDALLPPLNNHSPAATLEIREARLDGSISGESVQYLGLTDLLQHLIGMVFSSLCGGARWAEPRTGHASNMNSFCYKVALRRYHLGTPDFNLSFSRYCNGGRTEASCGNGGRR